MSNELLLAGRIILLIISLFSIGLIIKTKKDQRLGNQFFVIMMIFWGGIFSISLKPELIDAVLNTTGLVNRAQLKTLEHL